MIRPGVWRLSRRYSGGAVLLWTLLATGGMVVMAGMTYRGMYLQLIDWRTEQEQRVVRYAAHALLARCDGRWASTDRVDGRVPVCDGPASWQALHDAMSVTPAPARWRADQSLSEHAVGVDRFTWTAPHPTTGRGALSGSAALTVVEAFCRREVWIDDATMGRVDVATVRVQLGRNERDGIPRSGAEEGVWLQSIVARQTAPCVQTAWRVREIVEPWRRGASQR